MDLIGKLLFYTNPRKAIERLMWQREYKRLYEAAQLHHQHRRPKQHGSGDKSMDHARGRIRDWARYLDENHDLSAGILDTLVNKTVGAGIQVMPMILDSNGQAMRDLNLEIAALWREFSQRPEVTHELNFAALQRITARTLYRDGEILGQHVLGTMGRVVHGTRIPYSVELIEADYLPFEFNNDKRNIVHGVEKTAWGRPRAYHLYTIDPDDIRTVVIREDGRNTKRVPADRMFHAKFTRRVGQTRGVSVFHAIAHRLDDLRDYEESERVAARIGATMAAYIKKGTDFDAASFYSAVNDGKIKNRSMEFEGGMVYDTLLPGEDVGTIGVDRPNPNLESFRNSQLRALAAGSMTHYSGISKNYQEGTYSSQRQEMVESRSPYGALREYQVFAMYQPIYENFLTAAVLSNQIQIPREIQGADLFSSAWIAPPEPWIDPQKEANADKIAVDNHFIPWSQVVLQRTGRDPMVVLEQIRQEQEMLADLAPAPAAPVDNGSETDDDSADDDDSSQAA